MGLNTLTKGILVATAVILSACGPNGGGFSTGAVTNITDGGNGSLGDGGGVVTPPVEEVNLKGFVTGGTNDGKQVVSFDPVAGGTNDGKQVVSFDPVAGELLIAVPLPIGVSMNLTSTGISKYPGTRIYTSTSSDGTKSLVLAVPLRYVLHRDVNMVDSGRLPNGDPLPEMPGGELPFAGVSIAKDDVMVYVYVGMDSVGVFVQTQFNPYIGLSWNIVDQVQQKIGTFTLVPKKNDIRGGFFLGVHMNDKLARALDKFIR